MPEFGDITAAYENEAERNEIIIALIDSMLPEPDYLSMVAERDGVPADQLSEESKELVEYNLGLCLSAKESIIENFKEAQVSDSELESYIAEVIQFEIKTRTKNFGASWYDLAGNIKNVIKVSESLEGLQVWNNFFEEWKKELIDIVDDPKIKDARIRDFWHVVNNVSGINFSRRQTRTLSEIKKQTSFFIDLFKYKYAIEIQFSKTENYEEYYAGKLIGETEVVALDNHSPEQGRRIIELFDENKNLDRLTLSRLMEVASQYGRHFGFSETAKIGFERNILPALQRRDPQVDVLQRGGNFGGMRAGEFGLKDFVCHSYCSEVNPRNINRLLMSLHEIPTSNFQKLEQNRKDGLAMSRDFGALRDFIHDQRPLVREVINAMVKYYETKDPSELKLLLPKTKGYLDEEKKIDSILDLSKYDNDVLDKDKKEMKVIDVLRRLAENTKTVEEKPVKTSELKLNVELEKLSDISSEENLLDTLQSMNSLVEKAVLEKKIGIEPNMILALAFIERKVFAYLQKLTYEDQTGLYKKPWFIELMKFQELTNSTEYNSEDFNKFMQELETSKSSEAAYKLISNRVVWHITDLAKIYKATAKHDISGALWSGNVSHELIGISDWKPATTRYGERHREEQMKPEYLRNMGD